MLVTAWREISLWLALLVCADAKERELFLKVGAPEPTFIRFSGYVLVTGLSLALFSTVHPEHPLHLYQLATMLAGWIAFWILHKESLALLLAVVTDILCIYMMIVTSSPQLLFWLAYLSFHTSALWYFRRRTADVRFPGRLMSRLSTPRELPSNGANSYLLPVPNGILFFQPINPEKTSS